MHRKRGLAAFLTDVTNTPSTPTRKRPCAKLAITKIRTTKKFSPRGRHVRIRKSPRNQQPPKSHQPETSVDTLCQLLKKRPQVLEQGMTRICTYIERNTPFVMQKAIALSIFAKFVSSGKGIVESCDLASFCTNFSSEVIRTWAVVCFRDFLGTVSCIDDVDDESLEVELSSERGRHPKIESLCADETFQAEAKEYVREHGYVKGKPNLNLQQFLQWVKERWEVDVCEETVRLWLHKLGFTYKQFNKGVYFDGHERSDVVQHRQDYLRELALHGDRFLTADHPTPDPDSRLKPVIRVFHDESTFYSNADQTFHWTDGTSQALKQKSLGQAIMVSDFVEEVDGYLRFDEESARARVLLEHQTDGYFTNEMFIAQVKVAMDVFEKKYPGCQGMFIFDNAPSHVKKAEDALNADKMNVSDGGKQPYMRNTVWQGRMQRMVLDDGQQKGMKRVLEERGVDTKGFNASKMREELKKFEVKSVSTEGLLLVDSSNKAHTQHVQNREVPLIYNVCTLTCQLHNFFSGFQQ